MTAPDNNDAAQAPTHDHAFITGNPRCLFCGMTLEQVRQEGLWRMLTESFDRLATALERIETRP